MFSQTFKRLLGVAVLVGATAINVDAQAAAVVSSTSQITGFTSSLLSFSNNTYLQDVSASNFAGAPQTGTNIGTVTSPLSVGSGVAFADASPASGFGDLPFAFAGVNGGTGGEANSTFSWDFDFSATATGTATLSFEFLSSLSIDQYLPGERAQGSTLIEVLVNGTNVSNSYFRFFNDQNDSVEALFQDLNLSFGVTSGQTGSISVIATSTAYAAPVPVPAAVWLLGSALLGMTGVARRKS